MDKEVGKYNMEALIETESERLFYHLERKRKNKFIRMLNEISDQLQKNLAKSREDK